MGVYAVQELCVPGARHFVQARNAGPFYTYPLEKAIKREDSCLKYSKGRKSKGGYLVRTSLHKLAEKGEIQEDRVIDLTSWEKVKQYWEGTVSSNMLKALSHI